MEDAFEFVGVDPVHSLTLRGYQSVVLGHEYNINSTFERLKSTQDVPLRQTGHKDLTRNAA